MSIWRQAEVEQPDTGQSSNIRSLFLQNASQKLFREYNNPVDEQP